VGRPLEDVDTGYPKNGFKIEVGDSQEIEMKGALGCWMVVVVSRVVTSGTSKACGSSGRIGSSRCANEGRFPP
jgi:hypothetical protein